MDNKMGKKMDKCKAPGCSKWVMDESDSGILFGSSGCKLDPVSALYVDKTPEQLEADERLSNSLPGCFRTVRSKNSH